MTKTEDYRRALKILDEWEPFLLDESGLPGPRGNIELAQAGGAAERVQKKGVAGGADWVAEWQARFAERP